MNKSMLMLFILQNVSMHGYVNAKKSIIHVILVFDKASQNITKTMFYFKNLFTGDPINLKNVKMLN